MQRPAPINSKPFANMHSDTTLKNSGMLVDGRTRSTSIVDTVQDAATHEQMYSMAFGFLPRHVLMSS
jgi:hypothetical protein